LPLLIESLKNRIDDSLHAGHIDEYHGPGAPPDFDEAMLDGIGGAQLAPPWLRGIEERRQLGPDEGVFPDFADGFGLGRPISMRPLNMAPSSILMRAV